MPTDGDARLDGADAGRSANRSGGSPAAPKRGVGESSLAREYRTQFRILATVGAGVLLLGAALVGAAIWWWRR